MIGQLQNSSNNTNKLSPQEQCCTCFRKFLCSNNTNKLSPQELNVNIVCNHGSSNNTNKLSPQELSEILLLCI